MHCSKSSNVRNEWMHWLYLIRSLIVVLTGTCSFFLFVRMRDTARKIEEKYFSNLATHVEFLPVEWRSKLTLDGGTLLDSFVILVAAVYKIVPRSLMLCSLHVPWWDFIILLHVTQVSFLSDTVDSITPDKVRGLRDMLNSSAMDIMYYTSPLYRDEVSVCFFVCFFVFLRPWIKNTKTLQVYNDHL